MASSAALRRTRRQSQGGESRPSSTVDEDPDAATNEMLLRDKKTWSKGRLQRMRVMSAFIGNVQPSRKKVFTTIQVECDYKLYSITVHNKTIPCAKVFNPVILEKNSKTWSKLGLVERFELEDPEGTLTTVPKHYATNMEHLESFSITWTRVKSLPNEFFREGLKTLNLPRNQIKTLTGIEKAVDLSNLDVSSNMLTELPKAFGQLHNLTTLNISGNAITYLPENFGALSQLRVLDCSCNCLSTLPDSINNLIELTSLDVTNNNLTALPETIADLPHLEDLRARANQLQDLPQRFEQLIRLSSLNLRKNNFAEVPNQLFKITSLHSLNMRDNSIKSFPGSIPNLKTLILDSNALKEIDDGLLRCSNLQMLSLADNKIASIPMNIKNLKSLRVLHLSGNDIAEVPEDIGHLQQLRHLTLRSTQIQKLPNAILKMANLVKLDITDCPQLEDYIRLAHKDGGLNNVRKEMLQENSNIVDFQENISPPTDRPNSVVARNLATTDNSAVARVLPIENNSPEISQCPGNNMDIQACKHATIMLFDSPNDLVSHTEEQQQYAQALSATTSKTQESNETAINLTTIRKSQPYESQISGTSMSNSFNQDQQEVQYATVVKKKEGPPTKPKAVRASEDSAGDTLTGKLVVMDSGNLIRERLSRKPERNLEKSKRQSQV